MMKVTKQQLVQAARLIDHYSQYQPSPLSLKKFIAFGEKNASEKASFIFLKKEIPVRLANIMKEINLLPESLLMQPSVRLVKSWYEKSFEEVIEFENVSIESTVRVAEFCDALVKIRNRHTNVVETMAQGILELKDNYGYDHVIQNNIQYFLDRFYMSRISIRMLINQHTLLFSEKLDNHPRHVGCIDPHCDLHDVAKDAYDNARFLCDRYYLNSPEVQYQCINGSEHSVPIEIVYVPSHLYHIMFELIKNAMRAVVEYHGPDNDLPPIHITICKGKEDLTIKIADQGGGIPRTSADLLFQYMYSTAPKPDPESGTVPLAGYGYGLPLSRLYAKYFMGDLVLSSMEGYGTDAVIYLKVLSSEASELLPIFNKTSLKQYSSSIPAADWSNPNYTSGLHFARQFSTASKRKYSTMPARGYSTMPARGYSTMPARRYSTMSPCGCSKGTLNDSKCSETKFDQNNMSDVVSYRTSQREPLFRLAGLFIR
ncbi:unnamed protein product [Owenia fusiformis]|uniref:Protein-serine/threonine kinase n=1 Tax=Owenia fusiformis TaxID=6347 RepID=A0A8J1TQU5_OWEFU|nr:unnamed protein product [Owenia fusiformis]